MPETDHLTKIIEAVMHLQSALKMAGLLQGALEIRVSGTVGMGFESDAQRLEFALKTSPHVREMIPDMMSRLPTNAIAKVAGVTFIK